MKIGDIIAIMLAAFFCGLLANICATVQVWWEWFLIAAIFICFGLQVHDYLKYRQH